MQPPPNTCHHAAAVVLTTAHALLHSVKLGGRRRRPGSGCSIGTGRSGLLPAGFRLLRRRRGAHACKLGCLRGVELPTAEALAKAGGDAERRELTASSLPDEDAEKTETLWDVAALADPQARRVWAGFAASKDAPAPAQPAAKVVLKVKDLPAAIEFYTTGLGMTLLRQRALVPDEAALAAYVGFSDDDAGPESGASGAARLELRYVYGSEKVEPDAEINVVSTRRRARSAPASRAARSSARGRGLLTDPDGRGRRRGRRCCKYVASAGRARLRLVTSQGPRPPLPPGPPVRLAGRRGGAGTCRPLGNAARLFTELELRCRAKTLRAERSSTCGL